MFEISDLRRREIHLRSVCPFPPRGVCVWGGGGGSLICSYMLRLGVFLGVQNFELQYFWGVSEN